MVTYAITHILAESTAKTIDKINYSRHRINSHQKMFIVFLTMSVSTLIYTAIFKQSEPNIVPLSVFALIMIAILSFVGNVFDELSLKADDLSLREPLIDFEPMLAGLVGYVLFPNERKPIYLIVFIIGFFIVRWGIHRRKLNADESRGLKYLVLAVAIYGILPSLYKVALEYVSPSQLLLFRVLFIFIFTTIRSNLNEIRKLSIRQLHYGVASGLVYSLGAMASLYAIKSYGVVFTMLFFMLGPALRYLSSKFILKERVRSGEVTSSLMLAVLVAFAALIG